MQNTTTPQQVNEVSEIAPKTSKAIIEKIEALKSFDKKGASSFKRLLATGKAVHIANMGLNKAIKNYIETAKSVNFLTPKQMQVLTFKNVCDHIKESKYKNLTLFSVHQITLICNEVIKKHDKNTARAARAEAQNKKEAKK